MPGASLLKKAGAASLVSMAAFLAVTLLAAPRAHAEPQRRSLDLELDDVPGMKGYEIKVSRILPGGEKKAPVFFKIQGHNWSARLLPGKYDIELRSYDFRNVPGQWSAPQEVVVKLEAVQTLEPLNKAVVKSDQADEEKVRLSWRPVEGAEKYKVHVARADGGAARDLVVSGTSTKLKLTVAQSYTWTVTPVMEADLDGESSAVSVFTVRGGALSRPHFLAIDDINTVQVAWNAVARAVKYEFTLEKQDEGGQWKVFEHHVETEAHHDFAEPLPTGRYRAKLVAQATQRVDSESSTSEFKTLSVSTRSPAAIEQIKSEASYDTKTVIFGLASYTLTVLQYSGTNNDIPSKSYPVSFGSIGGTGRLGLGTWFNEDSKIGVLAVGDLSGVEVSGQTQTYFSGSLQGVYRERMGALGQLRFNLGLESRDLPVTLANVNFNSGNGTFGGSAGNTYQDKISNLGPVAGVTLLHGFTRKIGFQLNAQIFDSAVGSHTPNGLANVSQLSYQAGLLGSLNLANNLVGFAGYTYRSESAAYNSVTGVNNTVNLTGQYLNLTLEYGF